MKAKRMLRSDASSRLGSMLSDREGLTRPLSDLNLELPVDSQNSTSLSHLFSFFQQGCIWGSQRQRSCQKHHSSQASWSRRFHEGTICFRPLSRQAAVIRGIDWRDIAGRSCRRGGLRTVGQPSAQSRSVTAYIFLRNPSSDGR